MNLKDQIRERLLSMGAVLMSIVALIVALYLITIVVRTVASMMA